MEEPTIFFMFAGRRGNLSVNLPLIRRILDDHPNVEFHLWNLARLSTDSDYIDTISGERIVPCKISSGRGAYRYLNRVWDHYTHSRFARYRFVKIDDDVVFLETARFGTFLDAIEVNPDVVVSANIVNTGDCTPLNPELWKGFTDLDIPLLDVHESNDYATMAHEYFLKNWADLLGQPVSMVPTEDWLSINLIGMHWSVLCRVAARLGSRAPSEIAGRFWKPFSRVGDEGAVNMLPRAIMRGFTVSHLGFGPQNLTEQQEGDWRSRYAEVAQRYLSGQS